MILRPFWPTCEKMYDFSSNLADKRKNAGFFVQSGRQAKKCRIVRPSWPTSENILLFFIVKTKTDKSRNVDKNSKNNEEKP